MEEGIFTAADGTQQKAQMMSSTEDLYLEDGEAAGFVKPYREGSFAFVALLPPEGMSVQDYAATLTGERLQDVLDDARPAAVQATMPKFESEFGTDLSTSLKALGMPDAFDPDVADFTRLSEDADALCIGSVLHKTHIAVDAVSYTHLARFPPKPRRRTPPSSFTTGTRASAWSRPTTTPSRWNTGRTSGGAFR